MWPEDLIKPFRNRELEFDCAEMVLTQAASDAPVIFRGKGYVRQTPDDELHFRMYVTDTTNTDIARDFGIQMSGRAGRLYSDSAYFDLTITDRHGRKWAAKRLLPDRNWSDADPRNPVAYGRLWSGLVSATEPSTDKHFMQLHFFDDVRIPYTHPMKTIIDGEEWMTTSLAKFSAADCDFEVQEREAGFVVEVRSDKPFVEQFANRIQEAMQYILARSVFWRVQIRSGLEDQYFELSERRDHAPKTTMRPPINGITQQYHKNSWKLFSLYLEYILGTPDFYWNPCAYHIHNAREASGTTREAFAGNLSIAVEGIANLLPRIEADSSKKEKKHVIKTLLDRLHEMSEGPAYEKRIRGLLSILHSPSVRDRLAPLIRERRADPEHLAAWNDLRNTHVHPKKTKLKNITARDSQKMADQIAKTTVLLYHITFVLIGYEGPYADYGTDTWPSKDIPFKDEGTPSPG